MALRVEQLAAAAEVSVDTIRFYQGRGLLPPPRREGRIAWYGDEHVARLHRVRQLQTSGLSLATIKRLIDGELDTADEALVTAVAEQTRGAKSTGQGVLLTIEELADRCGIPLALLRAVEREGLLVPHRSTDGDLRYTDDDVAAATAGLRLLEFGLPLPEVLELARRHHAAMRAVAEQAVEIFDEYIRQPLRSAGLPEEEAAARLVEAFDNLLPATTTLVAHHFRRILLAVAQDHIDRVGVEAELEAVRAAVAAEAGQHAPEAVNAGRDRHATDGSRRTSEPHATEAHATEPHATEPDDRSTSKRHPGRGPNMESRP